MLSAALCSYFIGLANVSSVVLLTLSLRLATAAVFVFVKVTNITAPISSVKAPKHTTSFIAVAAAVVQLPEYIFNHTLKLHFVIYSTTKVIYFFVIAYKTTQLNSKNRLPTSFEYLISLLSRVSKVPCFRRTE